MAYMNQERKAKLAPAIKAVCKKYGVKATLSVYHHSSLVVTVKESAIDFINNYNTVSNPRYLAKDHLNVNQYWFADHFDGVARDFLEELLAAMNIGNHDRSDLQSDYFDVGWYTEVNIGKWDKPYVLTA